MLTFLESLFKWSDLWVLVPISLVNIIISVCVWVYQKRQQISGQHRLYIVLRDTANNTLYKVRGSILRKDFTRSEIRGVISMEAGGQFNLESVNDEHFYKTLHQLQSDNKRRVLCLDVNPIETTQFALQTMTEWSQFRQDHGLLDAAYECI
jgi:hypothetical protein